MKIVLREHPAKGHNQKSHGNREKAKPKPADNKATDKAKAMKAVKAFKDVGMLPTGFRHQSKLLKTIDEPTFKMLGDGIAKHLAEVVPALDISDDEIDFLKDMSRDMSPAAKKDKPEAWRAFILMDKLREAYPLPTKLSRSEMKSSGSKNRDNLAGERKLLRFVQQILEKHPNPTIKVSDKSNWWMP